MLWLTLLCGVELILPGLLGVSQRAWSLFTWIHFAYLDLLIAVPAGGLYVLFAWRERTRAATALAILGLAWLPVLTYATWIEPNRLQVENVALALGTPDREPLRIALLADLQARTVSPYEENAIARTLAAEPDLILIAGDWQHADSFEAYAANLPAFRALLAKLHAPLGVYMVQGNTEPFDWLERLTAGTGVETLSERIVELDHAGRTIALGGLRLSGYQMPQGRAVVRALEGRTDVDLRLLLAHKPDAVFAMQPDSPIDLLLAGHTHGGQVVVPFFGPPITLTAVPRAVAAGGLHELQGRRLYVSRGIGLERGPAPALRFGAPPELTILDVR